MVAVVDDLRSLIDEVTSTPCSNCSNIRHMVNHSCLISLITSHDQHILKCLKCSNNLKNLEKCFQSSLFYNNLQKNPLKPL